MSDRSSAAAPPRVATSGLVLLAVTSVSWGLSWPITKYVISQWPPLPARGLTGLAGALTLFAIAWLRGDSLAVPRSQRLRLVISAFFNVTVWMAVMGLALLWLPAGETAVIAYTMPVWTALLAWPLLGERMTLLRVLALAMAFGGIVALLGAHGFAASVAKLPGVLLALSGAVGFALGTVFLKRFPIALPGTTSAAWQIGIGSFPVVVIGLAFEVPQLDALSPLGWAGLVYLIVIQFCVAYLCWFAAVQRLPASVAAIGTMAVPVIGVVASAIALHEPLGLGQIAALVLTLAGVALATRS
ncbi:DMT family transporter [Rhodopseudomonas pseudopalustris]|uniref:EamA-like transporter family protein n=1 Tax=Rhodopseudomonas pseudopalustris TaxID=1513892 RepID=A0A1H8TEZ7_9BRAD|nr:DMT family transporter [Rhodopseudomonas pseudopalustris]SEO89068.1 EamA-like transporter family protein [Rhodopseudomonas pseudopalustris]